MPDWLESGFVQRALAAVALLCPACAMLGVPVVNLRMAFFSDAVGHAALTGVAVGVLVGLDPRLSTVLLALALGAAILLILRVSRLATDTIISVLASGVVAAGLALVSRNGMIRNQAAPYLYGNVLTVDDGDLLALAALAAATVGVLAWRSNRLLALALNPTLARAHGRAAAFDRWLFALLLAVASALAVRTVGVLLVTALLVVPAATARNLAGTAAKQPWLAACIGLVCGVGGVLLSLQPAIATPSGPTIVLLAVLLFAVSLVPSALRSRGAAA